METQRKLSELTNCLWLNWKGNFMSQNANEERFEELSPYIGKAVQSVRRTFSMSKEQLARKILLNLNKDLEDEALRTTTDWIEKIENGEKLGFLGFVIICDALERDMQTIFDVVEIVKENERRHS